MRTSKRLFSLILSLVLVFALLPFSEAKTGTLNSNSGTRHELCTALSTQAQAYYTGNYTYDTVSALEGSLSDPMSSAMFIRLQELMQTTMTNSVSYNSLTSYWPKTDANNGSSDAVLFYSDVVSSSYNREHVWPKSRASFLQSNGGSDLHHLRPTNNNVNSTRGNYTMGNVKGVYTSYQTYDYNGTTVLWYNNSEDRVEVNDNIKGDVARILLYVWCRWGEPNLYENDPDPVIGPGDDANNGLKVIESRETLLQWMEMDPVDTWEMSRNDQCENVQGNRNVFIDYPEYAWLIFGMTPPSDYQTPSGEATQYQSFTIEALANNADWGTVTVSGRTVTAVPNTGYYAADASVSPEGAATLTRSGNTFYVGNLTADCTVTVNFAEKTEVTVSYEDSVGMSASADHSAYAGDLFTLPVGTNVAIAGVEYTFVGWSTDVIEDTTDMPAVLAGGSETSVNADTTFHAVYRYGVSDGTASEWTQVTVDADLADGREYAFVCIPYTDDDTPNLAMNNSDNGKGYRKYDALSGVTGSFKNGTAAVDGVPETAVWTAASLGGGAYSFTHSKDGTVLALLSTNNANSLYKKFDMNASSASLESKGTYWRLKGIDSQYCIKLSTDLYDGFYLAFTYSYDDFGAYARDDSSARVIAACYMLQHSGKVTYHYLSVLESTPTPTEEPTPTPTPTEEPTPTPAPTAPPAIVLPTEGDYTVRIEGGPVSEHTETVNGEDCLKVELYLDGVTSERLLSSITLDLLYDPDQLTFVKSKSLSGTMHAANPIVPGYSICSVISANGARMDGTTPFLTLWFTLAEDLPAGTRIAFAFCKEISASSVSAGNYHDQARTVGAVLKPYFISPLYGDANCDGNVTAADAATVLRHLVTQQTLSAMGQIHANVANFDAADALSAADAAAILRYVVKLIDRFPIEE